MGYITAKEVGEMRKELKRLFPNWKFSIRKVDRSEISCTILQAPFDFTGITELQEENPFAYNTISRYQIDELLEGREQIEKIFQVLDGHYPGSQRTNYDNSDPQTDYFNVGWYVHLCQGNWDQPFVWTNDIRLKMEII